MRTRSHSLCFNSRVLIRLLYVKLCRGCADQQRSALARRSQAEVRGGNLLSRQHLARRPTPADKCENPSPEHTEPATEQATNRATHSTAEPTASG